MTSKSSSAASRIEMKFQSRRQSLTSPLILLILLALFLSLLQKQSSGISSLEILVGGVLVLIYILGMTKFFATDVKLPRPLFYLLGFGLWATFSVVLAMGNGVTLEWWFRLFFPALSLSMIALVSFIEINSWRRIRAMYLSLMIAGVIMVLISLSGMHSININAIANLQLMRRYGGGYFSAFSLCLALPLLFQYRRSASLQRLWIWLAVAISTLGLAISFTRTYWISTAVSLLFMLYLLRKARRQSYSRLLWRMLIIGGLGIAVFIAVAPSKISSYVLSRLETATTVSSSFSFQERVYETKGLLHTMLGNPLSFGIGNGFGAKFTYYSVSPSTMGGVGWRSKSYSHNWYVYLLFTTGLVGLSLILAAWANLLLSIKKSLVQSGNIAESSKYLLVGIATATINLLIASLMAPPLMSFKWAIYFGVLVGLALNLMRLPQKVSRFSDQKYAGKRVS